MCNNIAKSRLTILTSYPLLSNVIVVSHCTLANVDILYFDDFDVLGTLVSIIISRT